MFKKSETPWREGQDTGGKEERPLRSKKVKDKRHQVTIFTWGGDRANNRSGEKSPGPVEYDRQGDLANNRPGKMQSITDLQHEKPSLAHQE